MAKLFSVTSVIVMCRGILEEVHYFDNVQEAEELFRTKVKELNKDISAEEIETLLESGFYDDMNYNIWIH